MEDANFKELFQSIVDRYELAPDMAAELLQRILTILKNAEAKPLQIDSEYEILTEYLEREEKFLKNLKPDQNLNRLIITINGVRFRLGNVFDISQCDGKLDSIVKVPTDNSEELHRAVQQLMDSEDRIMYDPDLAGSSANGFFSPVTGEIHIKEGMSDLQTFRCILHEQAHSLLHGEDDAKELERGIKEIEAEAASYLCCSALGFPQTICYSTGYLAGWSESRTTRELLQSVSRIEKCARGILDWVTSLTDLKVVDC